MWQKLVNRSIARRLAISYMLTLFLILAIVGLVLYESLRHSLISDVKSRLASDFHIISSLVVELPLDIKALKQEIEIEPLENTSEKMRDYSQLLDASGAVIFKTPRINKVISVKKLAKALKKAKKNPDNEYSKFFHEDSGVILLTKKSN